MSRVGGRTRAEWTAYYQGQLDATERIRRLNAEASQECASWRATWRETWLPRERARIFASGRAAREEVEDNIVTVAEIEALGWRQDVHCRWWQAP